VSTSNILQHMVSLKRVAAACENLPFKKK